MSTAAPPELHLPDLPEVQLGGAPPADGQARTDWRQWLLQRVSNYLPLALMALLAAGTWWLVQNTPHAPPPSAASAPRQAPDYTMSGFSVTRFDRDGRVRLRIDGAVMRHHPQTDQLEIEGVRIHATAPDGRTTEASARRALTNGDASEVQLIGSARVLSQLGDGQALDIRGEFLHAFVRFEQLRSHLPVTVQRGTALAEAGGLAYDHVQRQLRFDGPVHIRWAAPNAGTGRVAAQELAP